MSTARIPKNVFSNIVLISYAILLCIVAGTGWFATGYLGDKARLEIRQNSESTISLHSARFTAEFENAERAVQTMSGSPWILPALVFRNDSDIANANSVLDRYNDSLNAAAAYLMDADGLTIASSNVMIRTALSQSPINSDPISHRPLAASLEDILRWGPRL